MGNENDLKISMKVDGLIAVHQHFSAYVFEEQCLYALTSGTSKAILDQIVHCDIGITSTQGVNTVACHTRNEDIESYVANFAGSYTEKATTVDRTASEVTIDANSYKESSKNYTVEAKSFAKVVSSDLGSSIKRTSQVVQSLNTVNTVNEVSKSARAFYFAKSSFVDMSVGVTLISIPVKGLSVGAVVNSFDILGLSTGLSGNNLSKPFYKKNVALIKNSVSVFTAM